MAECPSFHRPTVKEVTQPSAVAQNERLEIYKLLVEMADRVSQRRQSANSFYLSVNTLLVGGSVYLATLNPSVWNRFVISAAGMAICALWVMNIASYKTLNSAKFNVITEVEKCLVIQPFSDEWVHLDPEEDGKRHRPFHQVERIVPGVFIAIYAFGILAAVPWQRLGAALPARRERLATIVPLKAVSPWGGTSRSEQHAVIIRR